MSDTTAPQGLRARLPGLAARATGNTSVLLGSTIAQAVLRFGSNVVVAQFLMPEDFSVVLVISSLTFALMLMTDAGVGPFIVRSERSTSKAALDTVWTVNVLRGLFLAVGLYLAAPLAAEAFDDERLTGAIRVAAPFIGFAEFKNLGLYVAMRAHNERKNALVRLGVYAAHLPILVGAAWWLGNYWALVVAVAATCTLTTVASYLFYPERHALRLDRAALGDLWRFSRLIAASSLVGLVVAQFDRFFLAAVAPKDLLGVYYLAATLVMTAEDLIHRYGRNVYMPIVSDGLRAGERTPRVYYDPMRLVRPGLLFLIAMGIPLGPAFFAVVFKPEYAAGGVLLSLLSVRTLLAMLNQPAEAFLIADGRQRTVLVANGIRLAWTVGLGTAAYFAFGIYGLIVAICLRDLLPILTQHVALARAGVLSARREAVVPVVVAGGLAIGLAANAVAAAMGLV